jgi:hypothetical protein
MRGGAEERYRFGDMIPVVEKPYELLSPEIIPEVGVSDGTLAALQALLRILVGFGGYHVCPLQCHYLGNRGAKHLCQPGWLRFAVVSCRLPAACFASNALEAAFSGLVPVRARNTSTLVSVTWPPDARFGSCCTPSLL